VKDQEHRMSDSTTPQDDKAFGFVVRAGQKLDEQTPTKIMP